MSDMVEKVAIALFCADSANPHDPFEWKTSMINERGRERWREMARAAIEAMRDTFDEKHDLTSEHWSTVEIINAALNKVGPIPR